MQDKVCRYIKEYHMLEPGDRIVVGISGGADSVCLFFILLSLKERLGLEIFAVHINHGLRGPKAERDEEFVKVLAKNHGIWFQAFHEDVRKIAENGGLTEEEAGRKIRYQAFYQVCREQQCNKLAVAHNKNDNAETVIFHLLRGTGLKGLGGIAPVRHIMPEECPSRKCTLIRPLLCLTRREIEAYLTEKGQAYMTDDTNYELQYTRNRIRHEILPVMEARINPEAAGHIARAAEFIGEAAAFIEKSAAEAEKRIVCERNGQYFIEAAAFLEMEPILQAEILKRILGELAGSRKDIESCHIELLQKLCRQPVGKQISLPYEILGRRSYDGLVLFKDKKGGPMDTARADYEIFIQGAGTYSIPGSDEALMIAVEDYSKNPTQIPQNDYTKWMDYDKISHAISLRTRRSGDYFQIKGGGRKKMKDYFIDSKIPKEERDSIPLLAEGSHILWVLGGRMSEKYKVTEATKKILIATLIGGKGHGRQNQGYDTGRGY